jgi:hypothetical protein
MWITLLALAHAAPTEIAHQGRLLEASGAPFTGTSAVTFEVFDVATGGAALHTEVDTLTFSDGYFATSLGPFPSTVTTAANVWVQTTVGATTLSPRQQVFASFHALNPGPTGPQGPQGPAGPQGPPGPAGTGIGAASASASCVGRDGQVFYDATNKAFYGCAAGILVQVTESVSPPQSGLLFHFDAWPPVDVRGAQVTNLGGVTFNSSGKFGGGYSFIGAGGLTVPDSSHWALGTTDWTFEAWIKTTSAPAYMSVFSQSQPATAGSSNMAFMFGLQGNAATIWLSTSGTTWAYNAAGTRNIADGNWHHVAWCRNGTAVRTYVDGTLEINGTVAAGFNVFNSTRYVAFGYQGVDGQFPYTGDLDEMRFTPGTCLYPANFTAPIAPF